MANNDEARELFQTFSLLGSSMGEGYRQASAEEEKERRKARREQLLLTLFGPAVAEGVTGLIKAPFQEPVNRFLATEGANIRDASGEIVGYNRGGRDVKLIAKGYQDLSTTIKGVEEAAKRSGFSVYDYFQDGALTKLDDGLKDVVGEPDADVLALLDQGNRRDVAKKIAQRDYDEYVRGKALASNFPTQKATDAEIARLQLVPGNWGQGTYRLFKRLIRGESRDTVMERGIRNLEDTLGVEFTQEALDEARTIIDRAARVGDAYSIPTEIDRLIADNPKLGEKINLTRVEARNNLTRDLENAQWRQMALAGDFGNAAKRWALRNSDKSPTDFSDDMSARINIPTLGKGNQELFASLIRNDSSVDGEIKQLSEAIAQEQFGRSYEDLRDKDTDSSDKVDAIVNTSLGSIYGAAQMRSVEYLHGLIDNGETKRLEELGIFDPSSMKGSAYVLSNMREILRHHLDKEDITTGWWFWEQTNPRLTGDINLEEILSSSLDTANLGDAANTIMNSRPSASDAMAAVLANAERLLETESPQFVIDYINKVAKASNRQLSSELRELRKSLEEDLEPDPAVVEQNLARFVKGKPDVNIGAMPNKEVTRLQTDALEKLSNGLVQQWVPAGKKLWLGRRDKKALEGLGRYWREHFENLGKGWSKNEAEKYERDLLDRGQNILDEHQETFWDDKDVNIIDGLRKSVETTGISGDDFSDISNWFLSNSEHLSLLESVNYNLIDFVNRMNSLKK